MLVEKYNLTYISTGDILRQEIAEGTEIGLEAKDIINKGGLVSDELIDLFVQKIKIKPNHYEWKLNYLDDIFDNNINNEKNDFFLTRILFTQDVANRYLIHSKQFKFFRVKEPIKIDIYL